MFRSAPNTQKSENGPVPPYDRAQTTRRIFNAAVVEFAAEGIAGARVDRIAANADSNKALIYSYFGNKDSCSPPSFNRA
jgi:AcrR family transcriptional regulator